MFAQAPSSQDASAEPRGVVAALVITILLAMRKLLKHLAPGKPELMSRADFCAEMRDMSDRIHADHLALLEKLDANHRDLRAALERQGGWISGLAEAEGERHPTRGGLRIGKLHRRISKDREADGLGVERQRRDCEALAERLGWTVTATYTDDDFSAYSGKPRPAYRDLLAAIDSGTVGAVLAWHPARLHRSPRELEGFIDLVERHGTAVQTVTAGAYDLTSPTGRMQARIVGNVARFESEHKSERLRRKMDELADAGLCLE